MSARFRRQIRGLSLLATLALAHPGALAQDAPAQPEPEITELPKLIETVEAEYPPRALSERVTAEVMLDIDLDATGAIENVVVQGTATSPGYGFEDAAVAAVRKFVFTPATAGGAGVPVRISYRYRFTLKPVQVPPVAAPQTTEVSTKPKPRVVNLQGVLLVRGTREPIAGVTVYA